MEVNQVICGDALEVLQKFPEKSVDMIITSPPYFGLRSYLPKDHSDKKKEIGLEKSIEEHIKVLMGIFKEAKRVLKKEGNFWLNYGDAYASQGQLGGDFGQDGKITKGLSGRGRTKDIQSKCLLMLPERIALAMIDEGWILRDRICWAKQVLFYNHEAYTKGSAMPTSVKDRFNNTWEYLFHFTKNKKYWFDLDVVRIPVQTMEDRLPGIEREKEYPEAKRNKFAFNYRVRDAEKKAGNPQFKATQKEIDKYNNDYGRRKGNPNAEMFNSPRVRTQRTGMKQNKVNDPRGNHEGGPGSWRDFKDNPVNSYRNYQKEREIREQRGISGTSITPTGKDHNLMNNPFGKNLPNVWLIQSEPSKELHFARFPSKLCEIPIKSSCPKGGVVLDFFCGSGTALQVALKLGRNYIGIDLSEKYCEIAKKRLSSTTRPLDL